jgi:hypothetical protein
MVDANDIDLALELLLELTVFLAQPIVLLLDLEVVLDLLAGVLVPDKLLIFELELLQLTFNLGLLFREELDRPQCLLHLNLSLSKLVLDVFVVLAYLLEALSVLLLDPKHVLDLLVLQLHKLFQTFGFPLKVTDLSPELVLACLELMEALLEFGFELRFLG